MSIRVIGNDGKIRELAIEEVMGSDFDISDNELDDDISNDELEDDSRRLPNYKTTFLPDIEPEIESELKDTDPDEELASLMEVFDSMKSQFLDDKSSDNQPSVTSHPGSSRSSIPHHTSSPLAFPLSPVNDPSYTPNSLTEPITLGFLNTKHKLSPVKTRKKRKQDVALFTQATVPDTMNQASISKKRKLDANDSISLTQPVNLLPKLRVDIRKKKKKQTETQKLSTSLKWKQKKCDDDHKAFIGQTDLDDSFLSLETPYEFFKYFFDDDLLEHIVTETNRYCTTKTTKPVNINKYDLLKYFGILSFSTVMQCSNMRTYWNSCVGHPLVMNTMTINKFEKIREFLHFSNNVDQKASGEPGYDPLFKIRVIIESTRKKFRSVPFEECLAVDEQMCATKCHHRLKLYMPDKPHPYGFKFFVLSGVSGFAYDYEIYAGTVDMSDPNIRWKGEKDLGSSSNVVIRLSRYIPKHCFYKIYFDNYYTSLPLLIFLWKLGIYSLGTVRRNRVVNCQISISKKERGVTEEYSTKYSGCTIRNVAWMDNKEVMMLSTFLGAEPYHTVQRWNRKKKDTDILQCPNIIMEYNKYMGGVDNLDATLGRSKIKMKTRKFYMRLFYHILDLCIINAWVLYRRVYKQKNLNADLSILDFRIQLATTLMKLGTTSTPPTRGRPSTSTSVADFALKKKHPACPGHQKMFRKID